jgi:hypothetical protein
MPVTKKASVDNAVGSYTVANGRTVITDTGSFGPGETVDLPADEAKRFQELGFILGDDGTAALRVDGPAVVAGGEIAEA